VATRSTSAVDSSPRLEPSHSSTIAYALSLPNDASVAEILVNSRMEAMF